MTDLTERFQSFLAFATELHRNQRRNLLGVASIALEIGADEDQAIAAVLQDAVEDQGRTSCLTEIRERFGDRVAGIVLDCTDADTLPKPPWHERKEAYIASLAHKSKDYLLVSLADKTHNARAILDDLVD